MSRRLGYLALAAIPLAALGLFFLYPVSGMVARGFWVDGHFDPGAVLDVLRQSRVHRVLWFTLWSSTSATAIAVILGVPLAHVLHRLDFPGRSIVRTLVLLPFVLPTVVVGVAFRQLTRAGGWLGGWGLDGTATAIIAALVFFNVSVVVRTVGALWEGIDPRAEEAAASLGATPAKVFISLTLPALMPGIVSAASVVFLFCSTAFGVVLTMGGLRYANVETEIYLLTTQGLNPQGAAALSVLQVLVISLLLSLSYRARRGSAARQRMTPRPRRPRRSDVPLLIWSLIVLGFLMLPILSMISASLREEAGWGFANYRALSTPGADNALLVPALGALRNSLAIAGVASAFALSLGTLVAFLVSRRPHSHAGARLVGIFDGVFMLPLGVSAVTLGYGFLITLDHPPIDLRTSSMLIPVAQAMVALPLVVRVLAPVLRSIDQRQREAAASLGASPLRVLLAVDLPVAWRALLAASGFAFAVSLGEFGATSFLAREDNPTLPVVIYQLIGHPGALNLGMAMAASVVLAATTGLAVLAVERLRVDNVGAF